MADLVFGNVKHPTFVDMIVKKPYSGAGYIQLTRRRRMLGVCGHEWYGRSWTNPTWRAIYDLMSGERLYDALVDYSVQRSGSIVRLNDPRGYRSPYANGGSDGLEGDGPAFVRTLGIDAINADIVSIEREGKEEPYTDAQLEATAHLEAWVFDQAGVPWHAYPLNPAVGCVTDIEHFEFALKACPFGPKRAQVNERQNLVRGILKAAQESGKPAPTPPPSPVENPGKAWPNGWTTAELAKRFGELVLFDAAGKSSKHTFDENGQISNAWAARAKKEGITKVTAIPKPLRWNRMLTSADGVIDVVVFDAAGSPDWVLYNPKAGDRAGYRWAA